MSRNTLKLQLSGFNELITKLEGLNGDVKSAVTEALETAGKKIGYDTKDAVQKKNLPAGGIYSKGNTEKSIVMNPKVEWSGSEAEIAVGFDYSKKGAGGFLITGTPKIKPDYVLQKMYKQKKYMSDIQNEMKEVVNKHIKEKLGG